MKFRRHNIKVEGLLILISKTVIGYFVFFVFLFSVPIYKELKIAIKNTKSFTESRLVVGGASIFVSLADTPVERTQGLSEVKKLEEGTGLLFIFDEVDHHGIWMKDMLFAIDIIWLDETKQVVYIEENVKPETYPTVFEPRSPAKYVLEVPAGFVKKEGIKIRDQVTKF
jgi:uncharacterized membrane protein (UPF0127 family)